MAELIITLATMIISLRSQPRALKVVVVDACMIFEHRLLELIKFLCESLHMLQTRRESIYTFNEYATSKLHASCYIVLEL